MMGARCLRIAGVTCPTLAMRRISMDSGRGGSCLGHLSISLDNVDEGFEAFYGGKDRVEVCLLWAIYR